MIEGLVHAPQHPHSPEQSTKQGCCSGPGHAVPPFCGCAVTVGFLVCVPVQKSK